MKKFFVVGALVVLSSVAQATSPMIPVLAEVTHSPLRQFGNGQRTRVVIYETGEVMGVVAQVGADRGDWVSLGKLSAMDIARLQELSRRARAAGSELRTPPGPQVTCKAVNMSHARYTIGGDKFAIEERALPCGVPLFNDTRSSGEIVATLQRFVNQLEAMDSEG